LGALSNPAFDHFNLRGWQRLVLLRHPVICILGRDKPKELAFSRLAGRDRRRLAFAAFHQQLKRVQPITAFRFLRPVTRNAFPDEDRSDVAAEPDCIRVRRIRRLGFLRL